LWQNFGIESQKTETKTRNPDTKEKRLAAACVLKSKPFFEQKNLLGGEALIVENIVSKQRK